MRILWHRPGVSCLTYSITVHRVAGKLEFVSHRKKQDTAQGALVFFLNYFYFILFSFCSIKPERGLHCSICCYSKSFHLQSTLFLSPGLTSTS